MTIILGMIHVDQCYPDPSDPHDHHRWTNYWLRVTAIENGHMSRQVLRMITIVSKANDDLCILGAVCLRMSDEKVTSEKFTH